jgi:hypothetical protein
MSLPMRRQYSDLIIPSIDAWISKQMISRQNNQLKLYHRSLISKRQPNSNSKLEKLPYDDDNSRGQDQRRGIARHEQHSGALVSVAHLRRRRSSEASNKQEISSRPRRLLRNFMGASVKGGLRCCTLTDSIVTATAM